MHRSASTTRASDEFYVMSGMGTGPVARPAAAEMDQLPTYDPQSEAAKKEAMKVRFAENMIHLIPLVLIVCALVLWFFSHPDIDIASKDDSILARVKNMTIEGYTDTNSNWNSTTLPTVGVEDLDPIDWTGTEDPGKVLNRKLRP